MDGQLTGQIWERNEAFAEWIKFIQDLTEDENGAVETQIVIDFLDSAHGRRVGELEEQGVSDEQLMSALALRWEAFTDTYDPMHFEEHFHYAGDEPTKNQIRSGNLRDALATAARSHGETQGSERELLATDLKSFLDQASNLSIGSHSTKITRPKSHELILLHH